MPGKPLERNALHDYWSKKARERGETADRVIEKPVWDPILSYAPAVPVSARCPRFLIANSPHRADAESRCVHCSVPVYDPSRYEL